MKKEVLFILPPEINKPMGGYKIAYEYANRLSRRGWNVAIAYDCRFVGRSYNFPELFRALASRVVSFFRLKLYPRWFPLDKKIKKMCIYNNNLTDFHNMVATAYYTADLLADKDMVNRLYLIQDYECWGEVTEDDVKKTYMLGMKNIVISQWLKKIVDGVAQKESYLIRNGINLNTFCVRVPISKREKHISMLYHEAPYKGSKYGIEVLVRIKALYPEVKATLFGVPKRPNNLPLWIDYVENASEETLSMIYNKSMIFLYPSIEEGFGLTCVESMACGAALCSTNYKGVYEFAVDHDNAMLSIVKDIDGMVNNVSILFNDDELRCKISQNGIKTVKRFDWNKSVCEFEELLES